MDRITIYGQSEVTAVSSSTQSLLHRSTRISQSEAWCKIEGGFLAVVFALDALLASFWIHIAPLTICKFDKLFSVFAIYAKLR